MGKKKASAKSRKSAKPKKSIKSKIKVEGGSDPRTFFETLMATPSPTGHESKLQDVVQDYVSPFTDSITRDTMGNLIACINPEGSPRIMLAGHADEIGLQINYIDDNGYLWVNTLGGVDLSTYVGHRVHIHTKNGSVSGVIGRRAIHLLSSSERAKAPELKNTWIDLGVKKRKDAEKLVSLGDAVTIAVGLEKLSNDVYVARAFDDRVGVYIVMEALRRAKQGGSKAAVFSVSTTQEEIGTRGAFTSAYAVECGIGFAVDVGHATDYPGENKRQVGDVKIGGGPIITRGPNINPKLFDLIMAVSKRKKISTQIVPHPRGTGTDARSMQIARGGMATGLIAIPLRYMHTPVELLSITDVESAAELLAQCILALKPDMDFTL